MVVRYQGGDNAGHTVVIGDEVFKLHLVPSGVLYPHITSVIGSGVVVNPATLIDELDMLAARGIDVVARPRQPRGARDHAVPRGPRQGAARRASATARSGTTRRGIGPAYARPRVADRAAHGGPARRATVPRASSRASCPTRTLLLARTTALPRFDLEALVEQAARLGRAPRGRTSPTRRGSSRTRSRRGDHVLLEGAQGTLLDLDHGSYPYVTSSQPGRRRRLHRRRHRAAPGRRGHRRHEGLLDARRLGALPDRARRRDRPAGSPTRGHEFGTTTGRPRRVGWFDAVPLRYAVAVNSVSSIMLNKLDILSGIDKIRAVRRLRGRRRARRRVAVVRPTCLARATPIYEELPGLGRADPRRPGAGRPAENARRYVTALEEQAGVPIVLDLGRARADPDDRAGGAAPPAAFAAATRPSRRRVRAA